MDKIPPPPKSLTSNVNSLEKADDKSLGSFKGKGSFSYGCNNRLDEELMKLRREMVSLLFTELKITILYLTCDL